MAVPALVRVSDPGMPLDRGIRRGLEASFAVDLGGVRLHAGPRTDAFLRARGYPAATYGYRVFMPARRQGGGGRWWHVLAHEISHAIQQAQGNIRAGGIWEWHAEAAATAVTSGHVFADVGLQPPGPGHGTEVLAGFDSWEHRLLGDVPGAELARIATQTQNWEELVGQQIRLMGLWRDGGTGVTEQSIRAIVPGIGLVTLPGSGCLATCGEINAAADYVANADALATLPAKYMFPFLQQIRQESFGRLSSLLGAEPKNPDFTGAITPYLGEGGYGVAREIQLIDGFTLPLGVNHYRGLLARNACHFVPFAWQRWRHAHTAARDLALRAWQGRQSGQRDAGSLANLAWVAQSYADHFLQDSFAPGHLANKTLVMQWFTDWAKDSFFVQVNGWDDVRFVTAGNQPALVGEPLYDIRYPGPSNDPQTAEEQGDFTARMAATGVQAYRNVTREQAYYQYLKFLEATVVQLASKQVHDHFNECGLDVSSERSGTFRIYGDGKLLSDKAGIRLVADAVAASKAVISGLIAGRQSRTTPGEIMGMLPARIAGAAGRSTRLVDWHRHDLKKQVAEIFGAARPVLAGAARPSLGIVSADQQTTGLGKAWETRLPGDAVVTPYWDGQRLFAGSGGCAYELDPSTGQVLRINPLSGSGCSDVSLRSSGDTVFIGSDGFVLAAAAVALGTTRWATQLPSALARGSVVDILYPGDGHLYAACKGNVFELDPASGSITGKNSLAGLGANEVRLAATADLILAVTGNVIVAMERGQLPAEKWRQSLPSSGPAASILVVGQVLYAALNGYCRAGEPHGGPIKEHIDDALTGEVRLAADSGRLYRGGNGTVLAQPLADIASPAWAAELTGMPVTPVNLRVEGASVFATVNGGLYQLNPATGAFRFAGVLADQGEVRMASDGVRLYCGTGGYVAAVQLDRA